MGDTSEPVRSSAAEALGTLMKIIGERSMNPYMEGLDDIRKTKIKEFFETAVVKAKEKPPAPPPAAKAAPPKKALGKKPPAKAASSALPKKEDPPPPAALARAPPTKLAGPKAAGPGALKLKKPGAPTAATPASPKQAPAPPSPVEDEPPAPPKLTFGGRGLTGRPLSAAQPPPQPSVVKYVDNGLSAAEKAEYEALRNEKEQWLRTMSELQTERTRLLQQVNDLQNQVRSIQPHT